MHGQDLAPSTISFLQSYLKISSEFLYRWVCWTAKLRCLNVPAALELLEPTLLHVSASVITKTKFFSAVVLTKSVLREILQK